MKKKMTLVFIIVACMLSGCQKTPTTTANDNKEHITGGYTADDIIEDETTESWEDMTVVTITTEDINEVFQVGDKTITFQGTISIPDRTDGLYTYRAIETDYDEYFNNMHFLFGEYEDEAYVPIDVLTGEPEKGIKAVRIRGENKYHASINNSRAKGKDVDQPSRIYFSVSWNPIVEDSEVPIYMTNEEAKKNADEILARIGVKGFEFEKCNYGHYPVFEGNAPIMDSLAVRYRQYLQGVPVITYYGQQNKCGIYVKFVSRGLDSVYIAEYAFERVSRNRQCLTYEEALECFKDYVDSCDYYDGAIFTDISFQYVIKEEFIDGEKIRLVIPCYKFDALLEPALNNQFPDVYVDARNGMIYSRTYNE